MAHVTGRSLTQVTGYCHIGSQREGVPTQVRAGRPGNEGGGAQRNEDVI